MPSIELACIDQSIPIDFSNLAFAVESENRVRSHRELFTSILNQLNGCIYHLGNPDLKHDDEGRIFFAYDLLSRRCKDELPASFLEFDNSYTSSIKDMFVELLDASPAKKLVFLTDWQFGPTTVTIGGELSFDKFWKMHDALELRLNGLYPVARS